MPSTTFFNLEEKKKKKIIEAAIDEFSIHLIEDVSINQIIKKAHIARGSFYMYFKDKNDLYNYLLTLHQKEINKNIEKELIKAKGDFLEALENMYEKIINETFFKKHASFFKNMFINSKFTMNDNIEKEKDSLLNTLTPTFNKYVNKSIYKIEEEKLIEAFCFAFFIMNITLAQTFLNKEEQKTQKEKLKNKLSFLKYGIYKKED